MPAPQYVSNDDFKNAVTIKGTSKDVDVTRAILAASRAVDKETGRRFYQDAGPTVRKYTAASTSFVLIDDAVSITDVAVGGASLDSTAWFAEPANATADLEPFLWIESARLFTLKRQDVSVTGTFGWPEIPTQVEQITLIIASKVFKRTREAPFGIVQSGSLDGLALRITRDDPDLMLLLGGLKRAVAV